MTGNLAVLLTGATGLVGRFVLAELLRRDIPTIALVRSQPFKDAHSRIDEALAEFEKYSLLPRPAVVEADLSVPGLGLSADAWSILKSEPFRIIHSAASIRFDADSPTGEPYRSNVGGTQNLLEVASQLQIKQFHQVSTAYVQCNRPTGTRQDRTAFEVRVPSDALAGNDYERSKIQSENLVLNCGHIGQVSIYRPSIVVGDSRTGYTSTYHGFYAPLQLAVSLVRTLKLDRSGADLLRRQLGLATADTKNLVSVDWLAAAIVHLMETPAALGGIYHLTNPQPTKVHEMQSAILDALETLVPQEESPASTVRASLDYPPEMFRQQLVAYQSYFQDDPTFDRGKVAPLLGDLPCPAMDHAQLKHLAIVAIKNNFGWPRPPAVPPLRARLNTDHYKVRSVHSTEPLRDFCFELDILGAHQVIDRAQTNLRFCLRAGMWQLNPVLSSTVVTRSARMAISEQSLLSLMTKTQNVDALIANGRITLRGSWPANWLDIVRSWLEQLVIIDDQNQS